MGKSLVNMTLLLVEDDINHILEEQPEAIQKDFIDRDLFPDLIAYVLSRIPNLYTVVEEGEQPFPQSPLFYESAERQLARESLIREGIYYILEKSWHQSKSKKNFPRPSKKVLR